jgi:hypothetical protein
MVSSFEIGSEIRSGALEHMLRPEILKPPLRVLKHLIPWPSKNPLEQAHNPTFWTCFNVHLEPSIFNDFSTHSAIFTSLLIYVWTEIRLQYALTPEIP